MLLIEVNLTMDQKRKLLRLSKTTGKSFGQLAGEALAAMLEEEDVPASRKIESTNGTKY